MDHSKISIKRYSNVFYNEWNKIVISSKNSSLLQLRSFIEYHKDNFKDHSCIIYKGNKPLYVFPASEHGDEIRSHGGLTFGGLIMPFSAKSLEVISVIDSLFSYYRNLRFKSIIYKPTPYIYQKVPSEEDIFAINQLNASLYRYDISYVIDRNNPRKFSYLRRRKIQLAIKKNVTCIIYNNSNITNNILEIFFKILCQSLEKFNTYPVHSIDEIKYLMNKHYENIYLYIAVESNEIIAGSLVFRYHQTTHTQYMATTIRGRETGALDLVISTILEKEPIQVRYISFGRSCKDKESPNLNEGLVFQKEGFGASAVMFNQYKIEV